MEMYKKGSRTNNNLEKLQYTTSIYQSQCVFIYRKLNYQNYQKITIRNYQKIKLTIRKLN